MLHKSNQQPHTVSSSEEQLSDLCSNNAGLGCSSLEDTQPISSEAEALLQELLAVFIESLELGFTNERN